MVPYKILKKRFSRGRWKWFFLFICLLGPVLLSIFWPTIKGIKYIEINASKRVFYVDMRRTAPEQVTKLILEFEERTHINYLKIHPRIAAPRTVGERSDVVIKKEGKDLTSLKVKSNTPIGLVEVFHDSEYDIRVSRFMVNGIEKPLKKALEHFKSALVGVSYVDRFHFKNFLSRKLTELNSPIGNVLIGVLFVTTFLIAFRLATGLVCYLFPALWDHHLSRKYQNDKDLKSLSTVDLHLVFQKDMEDEVKLLQIAQILGPALGFMLTVSSLVEALAPAATEARDLGLFLSAIHIALISTFLGLLVRIMAIVSENITVALYERASAYLLRVS